MKLLEVGTKVIFPPYILYRHCMKIKDYYNIDKLEIIYFPDTNETIVSYEVEGIYFTRDCFYVIVTNEDLISKLNGE